MIFIGLGSNLCGEKFDSPQDVLAAALQEMQSRGVVIEALSPFYKTAPVPKSDQPWFVNAVAAIKTDLSAADLLQLLHDIEESLGRERRIRWEARIVDLDIIAYKNQISPSKALWPNSPKEENLKGVGPGGLIIPHPRLHERLFVLVPLRDICPDWVHPVLNKTATALAKAVEKDTEQSLQVCI